MSITVTRHDLTDACPACRTRDQEPLQASKPIGKGPGAASYRCDNCGQTWHLGGIEATRFA